MYRRGIRRNLPRRRFRQLGKLYGPKFHFPEKESVRCGHDTSGSPTSGTPFGGTLLKLRRMEVKLLVFTELLKADKGMDAD